MNRPRKARPRATSKTIAARTCRQRRAVTKRLTPPIREKAQVLGSGKFLRLLRRGCWEFASRPGKIGAVAIAAVNARGRLILIEQYRIPVGAPTIELPAGLVGDEPQYDGEQALAAAHRELLEETGYDASTWEELCHGAPSAGLSSEQVKLVRGHDPIRRGRGGGTGQELITVHEVPLERVESWLQAKARQGCVIDMKIYAALYFLTRTRR